MFCFGDVLFKIIILVTISIMNASSRFVDRLAVQYRDGGHAQALQREKHVSKRKQRNRDLEIVFDVDSHKYVFRRMIVLGTLHVMEGMECEVLVIKISLKVYMGISECFMWNVCRDFVTGFRKRKQQRRKEALKSLEKLQRESRLEERAEVCLGVSVFDEWGTDIVCLYCVEA